MRTGKLYQLVGSQTANDMKVMVKVGDKLYEVDKLFADFASNQAVLTVVEE